MIITTGVHLLAYLSLLRLALCVKLHVVILLPLGFYCLPLAPGELNRGRRHIHILRAINIGARAGGNAGGGRSKRVFVYVIFHCADAISGRRYTAVL